MILRSQNADVTVGRLEPLIVFVIFTLDVKELLCPERLDSFVRGPEVIGRLVHCFDQIVGSAESVVKAGWNGAISVPPGNIEYSERRL